MIFLFDNTDQLAVNTIRTLSMDGIQKANSGHPGLPMGAAPMAYTLWTKQLKVNPKNSKWFDRDRFVLSAGHGSMLLYSLLHLAGYDVKIDDLKQFRQWDSKTPGHPEVNHTDGVEATTGPLGQGIANAVGMAMTEAHLAAVYNKEGHSIVDHFTYSLCGDGDLMEGISAEAASLAAHLELGKLVVLYDSNDISLDGPTSKAFTENVGQRFEAYGWQHILVKDEAKCQEILEEVLGGKAFEEAAQQYSTCPSGQKGGDLGEFGKGQMVKEFEEAAFAAEIGHVVGPVATQFGYHLIKVEAKNEASVAAFEEVKEQIRRNLLQQKQNQAYGAKVAELKAKYM